MPRAQLPTAQKIMRDFMALNTTERETLLGVLATYHQETARQLYPAEVAGTASGKVAPVRRKARKPRTSALPPPAPAIVGE